MKNQPRLYLLFFIFAQIASWIFLGNYLASIDHGPKGGIPSLTFIVLGFIYVPFIAIGVVMISIMEYYLKKRGESSYLILIPTMVIPMVTVIASLMFYHRGG